MKRYIFLFTFLFSLHGFIVAQDFHVSRTVAGIQIHFRLNKSVLDLDYMGNRASFNDLHEVITDLGFDRIDSIVVESHASPEGPYHFNQKLARERARAMFRYITQTYPQYSDKLYVHPEGESWGQLRKFVVTDTLLTAEEKMTFTTLIDATNLSLSEKKRLLKRLPTYTYIYNTYYPRLRHSLVCVIYYTALPHQSVAALPAAVGPRDVDSTMHAPALILHKPIPEKRTILALKTNLLYDAVTALNAEIEVPIGKRWSIMVEDVFPWWNNKNYWAFQLLSVGAEGRYWLAPTRKRDVLSGHFIGIYGMGGKYDVQHHHDFCYQGEHWSAGLTYGYVLPVGKHLNFEFSVSAGYLGTNYRHYIPSTGYEELVRDPYKHGRLHYFGPTKAKISLVVPIRIPVRQKGGQHE